MISLAVQAEPKLRLVAEFDNVKACLIWLASNEADMLLIDLDLPDGRGLDVIQFCAKHHHRSDVIVITGSIDESDIFSCVEAGISGYLLKSSTPHEIVRAILDSINGGAIISSLVARKLLDRMATEKAVQVADAVTDIPLPLITKQEEKILDLITRGYGNKEIANLLTLSFRTVETHVRNIYRKLSVNSRTEAIFEFNRMKSSQGSTPQGDRSIVLPST